MTQEEHEWAKLTSTADLGAFLNRLRVRRGWTQADVAAHLGIPRRYLHELEAGKDVLAYTRLFALLRTLGAELTIATGQPSSPVKARQLDRPNRFPPGHPSSRADRSADTPDGPAGD